ncbi:ABC transporter ATP-binding protein [Candidatus Bathyarchaeota archaeon]|nr:ABC transporter ATP-binding protein [Candidatus Bathyarchaeota archaeon]
MNETIIEAINLKKWFPLRTGFLSTLLRSELYVKAVDDVSFTIGKGEIFGLAGESGSGKTTAGKLLIRLIEPTGGKIIFKGEDISRLSENRLKSYRKKLQLVFQDPYESLNPRMLVEDILSEPLQIHGISEEKEISGIIHKVMEAVKLTPPDEFLLRYPHELSGGQRQRVATARALMLDPEFIVADEPVSMLDVSIRAEVLNVILDLRNKFNVAFLFITHDLALARHICDRIAVMYLGKMVEMASADELVYEPLHPYTRALIEAVPVPDPTANRISMVIKGEIPSPVNPPSGCRFHTRCPSFIGDVCRKKEPELAEISKDHYVACHLYSKA